MNRNQYVTGDKMEENEIVLYQPNDSIHLEVRMSDESVWLTQSQIAMLFGVGQPAISKHLNNIFKSGELDEDSVYSILEYTAADGKVYKTKFYNLDAILSVGYRVNSINATLFRKWANQVLKDYLLRGYAINQRVAKLEAKVAEHDKQIDFFVRTSLPPAEGVFYNGQIFDAYVFVSDLIKTAKENIVLIDNYIDESVLMMLAKRNDAVKAKIITRSPSRSLMQDIEKHNEQYAEIEISENSDYHDRFLIIDGMVYHLGASLKDLGKRLFAFSKMEMPAEKILPA